MGAHCAGGPEQGLLPLTFGWEWCFRTYSIVSTTVWATAVASGLPPKVEP